MTREGATETAAATELLVRGIVLFAKDYSLRAAAAS
jgi:hypothetical protein